MGLVAIAMMAGATGTTTARVTGIGIEIGTVIVEAGGTAAADTIGLGDIRPSTAAKTAGRCKTVSASRTAATEQKFGWPKLSPPADQAGGFFILSSFC